MSIQGPAPQQPQDANLAAQVRLHPALPPVMRLSRKVLMGIAAVAVIAISAALIWGLYQRRNPVAGTELYNTENKTTPEGLSTLPHDYTGVPLLLPPS